MTLQQYSQAYQRYSDVLNQIQSVCTEILQNDPIAKSARLYLNERLSIDSQSKYQFGYFPNDNELDILFKKIPKSLLEKINLIYPYHVQNSDLREFINKGIFSDHNITLPIRNVQGNVISLMGRTILSESERKLTKIQKYKYFSGPRLGFQFKKSLHLFGLDRAIRSIIKKNCVIVVEGQLDCIVCNQYGYDNVVALGGSSLGKYQFNLIRRYTDKIILLLDNDIEGQRASDKIISRYSNDATITKLSLPNDCKDIDECLRKNVDFKIKEL